MNFKITSLILLTMICICACGCGVKGDPTPPSNTEMPSLMENYPDIKTDKAVDDVKRKR